MKKEMYCKVYFHYENVPMFMRGIMEKEYIKYRSEVVEIFNKHIDAVNNEWDLIGEPASFGKYAEDINPKYANLIKKRIQPEIDMLNKRIPTFCKYRLDDYGDITGYLPFIKKSKLWFNLEMIES